MPNTYCCENTKKRYVLGFPLLKNIESKLKDADTQECTSFIIYPKHTGLESEPTRPKYWFFLVLLVSPRWFLISWKNRVCLHQRLDIKLPLGSSLPVLLSSLVVLQQHQVQASRLLKFLLHISPSLIFQDSVSRPYPN